eukprot:6201243-Pleurochrysis_carterae.AAC.1
MSLLFSPPSFSTLKLPTPDALTSLDTPLTLTTRCSRQCAPISPSMRRRAVLRRADRAKRYPACATRGFKNSAGIPMNAIARHLAWPDDAGLNTL